jgi:hypothetical protein
VLRNETEPEEEPNHRPPCGQTILAGDWAVSMILGLTATQVRLSKLIREAKPAKTRRFGNLRGRGDSFLPYKSDVDNLDLVTQPASTFKHKRSIDHQRASRGHIPAPNSFPKHALTSIDDDPSQIPPHAQIA